MKNDFLCNFFKVNLNHTHAIALKFGVIQCPTDTNMSGFSMFDTIREGDIIFFTVDAAISDVVIATSDSYTSDINRHDEMYPYLDSSKWRTVEFKVLKQKIMSYDSVEKFLFNRTFRSSNFCAKLHPKDREGFRECLNNYFSSEDAQSQSTIQKEEKWSPSSYVWEKSYLAINTLCSSDQNVKERVGDSWIYNLSHLNQEELSPELRELFDSIDKRLETTKPTGMEGSITASLRAMDNESASEIAKDIFKFYNIVMKAYQD